MRGMKILVLALCCRPVGRGVRGKNRSDRGAANSATRRELRRLRVRVGQEKGIGKAVSPGRPLLRLRLVGPRRGVRKKLSRTRLAQEDPARTLTIEGHRRVGTPSTTSFWRAARAGDQRTLVRSAPEKRVRHQVRRRATAQRRHRNRRSIFIATRRGSLSGPPPDAYRLGRPPERLAAVRGVRSNAAPGAWMTTDRVPEPANMTTWRGSVARVRHDAVAVAAWILDGHTRRRGARHRQLADHLRHHGVVHLHAPGRGRDRVDGAPGVAAVAGEHGGPACRADREAFRDVELQRAGRVLPPSARPHAVLGLAGLIL